MAGVAVRAVDDLDATRGHAHLRPLRLLCGAPLDRAIAEDARVARDDLAVAAERAERDRTLAQQPDHHQELAAVRLEAVAERPARYLYLLHLPGGPRGLERHAPGARVDGRAGGNLV